MIFFHVFFHQLQSFWLSVASIPIPTDPIVLSWSCEHKDTWLRSLESQAPWGCINEGRISPYLKDLRSFDACINHLAICILLLGLPWQNTIDWVVQDQGAGQSGFWWELSHVSSYKDTNPIRQGPPLWLHLTLIQGKTCCDKGMFREGRFRKSGDLSGGRGNNIWVSKNSDEQRHGGMKLKSVKKDE